jgi:hypothetical protein
MSRKLELSNATLAGLSDSHGIPQGILDATWSARLADDRPESEFQDPAILAGAPTDFSTIAILADQLFRWRQCEELLAAILTCSFGVILATGMVGSIAKRKKRAQNEGKFRHVRTRWSNSRPLYSEIESIRSIACGLLFNAESRLSLAMPVNYLGSLNSRISIGVSHYRWELFDSYNTMTGETVRMAARCDAEDLNMLETVIEHNQNYSDDPSKWQFVMLTTRENEMISQQAGSDILTVRRIKKSLQSRISNNVIAAFGAAAFRFYLLEFGHSTEFSIGLDETRAEKMSRHNPDFIPDELVEVLREHATPLENRILDTCGLDFPHYSPDMVLNHLEGVMTSPPSRATFFRHWGKLMERTRGLILREKE